MISSDGIVSLLLTITPTGEILIPVVGVIFVDKLSLNVAIKKIKKMCLEKYNNAKINISLINLRRFKIQISGAVSFPGFVNIDPVSRLGDIINVVGGFHQLAKEYDIEIQSSSGEKRYVNYTNFVINGDLDENPQFIEGDKIYVPFGNIEDAGIILRGAIKGKGYDIIQIGETLQNLLQRKIELEQNADISNILITRENNDVKEVIVVSPKIFSSTILKPGDIIDFSEEKAVMVNGFVKVPGKYQFSPGFKAADYIGISGGNLVDGDSKKVTIYHANGSIEVGQSITIQRGDILVVPQTRMSMFFGKLSLLELVSAVFTIYLAFLAAGA
jgi:protein involved in polysaccharide export with SLBB domain